MAKKPYGPKYEKEQRKLKPLKRDVLDHLKKHGPKNYDLLYVLFDQGRTARVAPVLQELLQDGSIRRAENDEIEITASGLSLLEDGNNWLT